MAALRVSVCPTKLALTEVSLFGSFIQWKKSSNDELSSKASSSCDVKSLRLAVKGRAFLIASFSAIESGR